MAANLRLINQPIELRPYSPKKEGIIESHVKWLRQERSSLLERIGIVVLVALETLIVSLTLIGIYFVIKAYAMRSMMAAVESFHQDINRVPPSKDPIEFKTGTESFNHIDDFAISDDTLWFRGRNSQEDWKPIYFAGFEKGVKPIKVSCDGANLAVEGDDGLIYYKKVLKERQNDLDGKPVRDGAYYCIDKASNNNWKDRWFSLSLKGIQLNNIFNIFTGYLLEIPKDCKAWAMSQRGRFASVYEDIEDRELLVGTGVTTLLTLSNDGKNIRLFDPWSPLFCDIRIHMPQTETTSFIADNMSVSASTAMVCGYEHTKDQSQKTFKIYTQIIDIDYPGINPINGYTYDKAESDLDVQVLPCDSLREHPLNLQPGEYVTKNITIIQTGHGNLARELRIEGESKGQYGYFYKMINDTNWQFMPVNTGRRLTEEDYVEQTSNDDLPFETSIHTYAAVSGSASVRLEHFGDISRQALEVSHDQHPKVSITMNGETVTLDLYHRLGLIHCLDKDELVRPQTPIVDPDLAALVDQIFKDQLVCKLNITRGSDTVSLLPGILPELKMVV